MLVGSELRSAREKLGLSAEQISQRTKIQLPKIEALERGEFTALPGGIYLDGIVRAYANEVGVRAEPLIDRVRQERAEAIAGSVPPDLSGFHSEKELIISAQGRPIAEPAPATHTIDFVIDHPLIPPLPHTAVARDYPARRRTKSSEPGAIRRFGRAVMMLALLAAIGWGAYSFQIYRLSNRHRAAAVASPPAQERLNEAAATEAAAPPSDPQSDSRVVTSGAQTSSAPPEANSRTSVSPSAKPQAPTAAPRETPPPDTPAPAADNVVSTRPARDVSGSWTLSTQLESSSHARFAGLHLGYEISLEQSGNRILGSGRKVTENGDGIGSRAQTPIRVAGTIDGDRLTLVFTEEGTRRTTEGKFVLLLDEDGTLRGRFSSTAAQSSGTVEARRVTFR